MVEDGPAVGRCLKKVKSVGGGLVILFVSVTH